MHLSRSRLPLIVASLALTAVSHAADYDLRGDFSLASNPDGVWTYGSTETLGGTFTPFTLKGQLNGFDAWYAFTPPYTFPYVGINVSGQTAFGIPANGLSMHTGGFGEFAVSRFTAPTAGNYASAGSFGIGDYGDVDVHVLVNGISQFDGVDGATFSLSRSLAAGDTIDFVVGLGNNRDFTGDSTPVEARIAFAPVPEPASLAVLGLGAAAFLRRRKA